MGFPILERWYLYIESGPRTLNPSYGEHDTDTLLACCTGGQPTALTKGQYHRDTYSFVLAKKTCWTNSQVAVSCDALTFICYCNKFSRCDALQNSVTLLIIYDFKCPVVAHSDNWSWTWGNFVFLAGLRWTFTLNFISYQQNPSHARKELTFFIAVMLHNASSMIHQTISTC